MNRKAKNNFGSSYEASIETATPGLANARTSINCAEVIFYEILTAEIESLVQDQKKRERYFAKLFDPIRGKEMRTMFAAAFVKNPPVIVYGYPRLTQDQPCIAITLEEEHEDKQVLGNYIGETLENEKEADGKDADTADYVGSIWQNTFGLIVCTENPLYCTALYVVLKAILVGASATIEKAGFMEPTFSGGELAPNSEYLPENLFCRVLHVQGKSVFSVPVYGRDSARARVSIHVDDVTVDGVRGGVHPYTPGSESGEE